MGKVFSWTEIKESKIPQLDDFKIVVRMIRQTLEATDGVIGAIIFGSAIWKSFDERSDIDCVVLYKAENMRKVVACLREINEYAAILNIPTEIIPLDVGIARTPLHYFWLSFVTHLGRAVKNGWLIKENPLPYLFFESDNKTNDLRGYFRHKLEQLEKGISKLSCMEESELCRFLQKALEAPVHVARKMLWWQNMAIPDDAKKTVKRCYMDMASPTECELFGKLCNADRLYTMELLRQLHCPDEGRYLQVIEELKELSWDSLEFVKLNALRLC